MLIDKRNLLKEAEARETVARTTKEAEEKRRAAEKRQAARKRAGAADAGKSGNGTKAAAAVTVEPKKAGAESGSTAEGKAEEGKKTAVTNRIYVEYGGKQIPAERVLNAAVMAYGTAHPGTEVKTVELYIKPEDNAAYYVINGEAAQDYRIEL